MAFPAQCSVTRTGLYRLWTPIIPYYLHSVRLTGNRMFRIEKILHLLVRGHLTTSYQLQKLFVNHRMKWIYSYDHSLTHSLTHWAEPFLTSRQELPSVLWYPKVITVFTRALHWPLSWARSIQSIPSHPISLRAILILFTYLRLGLPSGLFPSGFPTNILHAFRFSTFVLHALPIS
jgi:hypothetical protein